jgi:hypothetical protein
LIPTSIEFCVGITLGEMLDAISAPGLDVTLATLARGELPQTLPQAGAV